MVLEGNTIGNASGKKKTKEREREREREKRPRRSQLIRIQRIYHNPYE